MEKLLDVHHSLSEIFDQLESPRKYFINEAFRLDFVDMVDFEICLRLRVKSITDRININWNIHFSRIPKLLKSNKAILPFLHEKLKIYFNDSFKFYSSPDILKKILYGEIKFEKNEDLELSNRLCLDYILLLQLLLNEFKSQAEKLIKQSIIISEDSTNYLRSLTYETTTSNSILNNYTTSKAPEIKPVNKHLGSVAKKPQKSPNIKIIKHVELLYNELRPYFEGSEDDLKKVLSGEEPSGQLIFPYHQNSFVELFRRLRYNRLILNSSTEIAKWICAYFSYSSTNDMKEIKPFNYDSVYTVLTKDRDQPSNANRICKVDWLPYKTHSSRQNEKLK